MLAQYGVSAPASATKYGRLTRGASSDTKGNVIMIRFFILGFAAIAEWVWLAFVRAMPNGWIHLFLAAGVMLIALGVGKMKPAGTTD